jgi:hypothetical protein
VLSFRTSSLRALNQGRMAIQVDHPAESENFGGRLRNPHRSAAGVGQFQQPQSASS